MEFLHEKGLYLGNLHSGNIILSSETAKIINVTGLAGGQSSRLRGLAVRVKVSKYWGNFASPVSHCRL